MNHLIFRVLFVIAGIGTGIILAWQNVLQPPEPTQQAPVVGYPAPVEYEGYPAPYPVPPVDWIVTEVPQPMQTPTPAKPPEILECSKNGSDPWICYAVTAVVDP